ncbi:hypothetical protein [Natronomonas salsuginis]|uniref:Uncharacterized protein n=1 Tax=Natronomonas salsuginis TaxID=2217661 RepID=A0A4U5JB25_9EURY|nr:hypothetical protein [Natronomonas salsuginis]TKR25028.1 hypothetical protein DM868_11685 [Natronomonas salsuginis]
MPVTISNQQRDKMSTLSHKLKELAGTIEALENNGTPVTDVTTNSAEIESGKSLVAALSITVPLPLRYDGNSESAFSATEVEVTEDDSILVSFEGEITDQELEVITTDHLEQQSEEADTGTPPHRDPDALREAYEQNDTFVEMQRALGSDVTPEAVRQQMIKHGIHEITEEKPSETDGESEQSEDSSTSSVEVSEDTRQAGSSQTAKVFVSDGGFPVDLTVDDLKDVVQSSHTLYEATQRLDTDLEEAREMLKRLNLLDLVTGRLSACDEQTVTGAEIDRRIRSSGLVQV